jgi:hypothetical protein
VYYKNGENSYGCCSSDSKVVSVIGSNISGLQACCGEWYGENPTAYWSEMMGGIMCCDGNPYKSEWGYECCSNDSVVADIANSDLDACCYKGKYGDSPAGYMNGSSPSCCAWGSLINGECPECDSTPVIGGKKFCYNNSWRRYDESISFCSRWGFSIPSIESVCLGFTPYKREDGTIWAKCSNTLTGMNYFWTEHKTEIIDDEEVIIDWFSVIGEPEAWKGIFDGGMKATLCQ